MDTHTSLAWKIPWTEESGGLPSRDHKELDVTEHAPTTTTRGSVTRDETVVEGAIGKGLCREVTFQMRFQGREGKGCSF